MAVINNRAEPEQVLLRLNEGSVAITRPRKNPADFNEQPVSDVYTAEQDETKQPVLFWSDEDYSISDPIKFTRVQHGLPETVNKPRRSGVAKQPPAVSEEAFNPSLDEQEGGVATLEAETEQSDPLEPKRKLKAPPDWDALGWKDATDTFPRAAEAGYVVRKKQATCRVVDPADGRALSGDLKKSEVNGFIFKLTNDAE